MADDLFPLDMHDGPVCEEEEEEGMPCEDEQVRKAKKLKLLYVTPKGLVDTFYLAFLYRVWWLCRHPLAFMSWFSCTERRHRQNDDT